MRSNLILVGCVGLHTMFVGFAAIGLSSNMQLPAAVALVCAAYFGACALGEMR